MSSRDYIKGAKDRGLKLSSKAYTLMVGAYYLEMDGTTKLSQKDISSFQELIGMLRWVIEIGRLDIHTEVSLLLAYPDSLRLGNLEQVLHIFAFLKRNPKLVLYFDPQLLIIPVTSFNGDTCLQRRI